MRTLLRPIAWFAPALIAISLAACGGNSSAVVDDRPAPTSLEAAPGATTPETPTALAAIIARPAILADLPLIEQVAPAVADAGRAPTFEWRAVDGAVAYRLSVLGPDAPSWGWQGQATSVRYGGVAEGVSGPSLLPGSWWSVAALGADGGVVAASDMRPVSPAADPGLEPEWAEPASTATASDPVSVTPLPTTAAVDAPGDHVCDLMSTDEITTAIKGTWLEPKPTAFGAGAGWCDWTSEHGSILSLSVGPAANYDPDGWGADRSIDDIGFQAYSVEHGWDRRIGFVHDDVSVMLIIDYTKVDPPGFESLARLIEQRLP
jgi:hypothetical protein